MKKQLSDVLRRLKIVLDYLIAGDLKGLYARIKAYPGYQTGFSAKYISGHGQSWVILTTSHTLYIAHLLAERLSFHGCSVNIINKAPVFFNGDFYIVLCPQMFTRLPPRKKRIIFQLEQSISTRWFTTKYLNCLRNSLAVIDYSLKNIEFLDSKKIKYPLVYYVPIGTSKTYGSEIPKQNSTYQVLFYGDSHSSTRRQKMLTALQEHFTVKIINAAFGDEIQFAIKSVKVVINIHYYENALLETSRIMECLTLGVPVVSESSQDQTDYPELSEVVNFFEADSIPAMIAAVQKTLDNLPSATNIQHSIDANSKKFKYMFDRFLIGMGFLPTSQVTKLNIPIPIDAEFVALSLPETIARRKFFETIQPKNCHIFEGIRRSPGWVGCGLSYVYLADWALKNKLSQITVMEDDVLLKENFEESLQIVREYLAAHSGKWDVFSGLIADVDPGCLVTHIETYKGIQFITINKMVSAVFNIYNESLLHLLLLWDSNNLDMETNTIDRFIEKQINLRIIVTLPFFVGHREEVYSTLWRFENTKYIDMIANSQKILEKKVVDFKHTHVT